MIKKRISIITNILLAIIGLIYVFPIILVIYNSFKTYGDILTNVIKFPTSLYLENFIESYDLMKYRVSFVNSVIITTVSTLGIVVVSSLAGYKISRTDTKYSKIFAVLFTMPMLIPIQTIMITLTQEAKFLGLMGSRLGLVVLYLGANSALAIFLYIRFVKTVPKELDESAIIDGCNSFQTFILIIFPLLKPITATIFVLNFTKIWNDFLLPLLIVNGDTDTRTLPIAFFSFFGQYVQKWNLALASSVMIVAPSITLFIIFQKHIIKGITAGAVKG